MDSRGVALTVMTPNLRMERTLALFVRCGVGLTGGDFVESLDRLEVGHAAHPPCYPDASRAQEEA
jgi:hypothetical protein